MELFTVAVAVVIGSIIYAAFAAKREVRRNRAYLEQSFGQAPTYRTDMTSVDATWVEYAAKNPNANHIDDITWNDLDMDEVFHRISICQTSIGEEELYKTLRLAGGVPEKFETHLAALLKDKENRLKLQVLLSQLGRAPHNGLAAFLAGTSAVKTLDYRLLMALGLLPLILLLLMPLIGYLGLVLAVPAAVFNIGYAIWFKGQVTSAISGMRYLSKMLWCTGKISAIHIEGMEDLLDEMRRLHPVFKSIKASMSTVATEHMVYNGLDIIVEMGKLALMTDVTAYAKSANLLLKNKEKARELYEKVGLLDMLISVASFRKSLGVVCTPVFHKGMNVEMENMGHPLILRPVENSCEIKRDTLITGSNASGKSTFIKAVAINALLAQAINTCAAKKFEMPRAMIVSSMALRDSIVKGDSYFVAEIKSLRRIMELARKQPCLCFVDEILRGTNTIERIAASAAVLYSLSRENCLCLVASHDIELTRILQNEFDNCHFSETVTDAGVTFDYTLKPGPSNTRNAILLLSTMGFDGQIIDKAHVLVKTFEDENAWPMFAR
jgi:Mismatch repair ATPase (MutS family)